MSEANWGLSQDNLQLIVNILKKFLTDKSKFEVYVFGSRAKNKNRKYSDFDLWIDSVPELSANEISSLREDFENSELPIKVDVLTNQTCLAEYRARIVTERVFWFGGG